VLTARFHPPELRLLPLGHRTLKTHLQQVRVAEDGVDGRADLVAHRRQKVALRAVRRLGLGARFALPGMRLPENLLDVLLRRDVPEVDR
jgi:hypothetical protein